MQLATHDPKVIRATVTLAKLLDGRDIRDVVLPIIRDRKAYRGAVSQLAQLGFTCEKLPQLTDTDLEQALKDLTGDVPPSRRKSAERRAAQLKSV